MTKVIAGKLAAQIALATTKAQPVPIAVFKGLLSWVVERQNQKQPEDIAILNVCLHESNGSSSNQTPDQVEL